MTPHEKSDEVIAHRVIEIFKQHKRRYGSRRIVQQLRREDPRTSRRKVSKTLKNAVLSAIQPRSFKPRTTESMHKLGYNANLLLELDVPAAIGQLWVGDITYVPIRDIGFGYLAVLMDRFSRRIVGWDFRDDMTEQLTLAALRMAIGKMQPAVGLIHHSDRGGQYAGKRYRGVLKRAAIQQSMSRAGDCYDNAFMESCFGTIKTELEMTEYNSIAEAETALAEYLRYYNEERSHSSLGYLSPVQFEAAI